jgi:hypothetical protein
MEKVLEEVQNMAKEAFAKQEPSFIDVEVEEIRQEKIGEKEHKIKRLGKPEERLTETPYKTFEVVVDKPARSYAELRADFISIYNGDRIPVRTAPQVDLVAGLCAEIYMADHTYKSGKHLQEELCERWPWGQQSEVLCEWDFGVISLGYHMQKLTWLKIIARSKHIGSGTTTYRRITHDHVKKSSQMHQDEYWETTFEPIYQTTTETVKKAAPAPPREVHEFLDSAKEQMAKSIRSRIMETLY